MSNKLIDEIDKISKSLSVVSFDVFDTLITRDIDPNLVINAAGRFVCFRLGIAQTSENISKVLDLRQKAWEQLLSTTSPETINFEDATLNQMFPGWIKLLSAELCAEADFLLSPEMLLDFELGLEKLLVRPIIDSLETVKLLRNRGTKILFISDMYLDDAQISNLLDSAGYSGLFDGGFVSGQEGLLKRTGNLFRKIINSNVKIDLHIGDNLNADYVQPNSLGIPSLHWESNELISTRKRISTLNNVLSSNPELTPYALQDLANRIHGKSRKKPGLAANIYSLFALNVLNEVQKKPAKVVFPSREGILFKACFDSAPLQSSIPYSSYAPLSREIVVPSLYRNTPIEAFRLWTENDPKHNLLSILRKIGFSDAIVRDLGFEAGFESIIKPLNFDRDFLALIRLCNIPLFQEKWYSYVQYKDESLNRIIAEYFPQNESRYFVDLGWNGSIQANLAASLPSGSIVHGLYFGLNSGAYRNQTKQSSFRSLVSSQGVDLFGHVSHSSPQLLEMLLLAPHPSVTSVPNQLNDYSWVEIEEKGKASDFRAGIHSAAIDQFKNLSSLKWLFDLDSSHLSSFINLCLATQFWLPTKKFVELVDELQTDVGYGQTDCYGVISKDQSSRGYSFSIWKQGWSVKNLPYLKHILKLSKLASGWNQLFPPQLAINVGEINLRNLNYDIRRKLDLSKPEVLLLSQYYRWTNSGDDYTGDYLSVRKIIYLRIILAFTNVFRSISRKELFSNASVPTKKLIKYRKIFSELY